MKQGKRITATMVISSALIFGGCNTASTDKAENEKQYTDTAEIVQEAVPAPKQSSTKPQTKDPTINQKDKQGRRQGLWIVGNTNNHLLEEVYYYNNRKNGFYKGYYSNGKLGYLGEYNNDKPIGIWYYFDEKGFIVLIEQEISENKKITITQLDGKKTLMPYYSYIKEFYKNGLVAKEGWALYEDIEIDYYRYGNWKYYDEAGKLIKEENYKEGRIAD